MSTPPNDPSDPQPTSKSRQNRSRAIVAGAIALILVVIFGYMLLVGGLVD
ncbi:hypothetical protein [Modestobacter roseus]|uniref:Uncharacterized protein n=1 Tax=Modestobacter roseus TaxID=1181884 RepID=A0A562IUI0_9ACTN|nr:hypothetical protein [Modestobacter roseus]TWH74669.1 hypothetical protein JD78_03214 [Modestobacter roseus]